MCSQCRNTVSEESLKADAAKSIQSYGDMPIAPRIGSFDDDPTTLAAPQREVPAAIMMQDQANDRLSKAVEILHERTSGLRHAVDRGEDPGKPMRDFGSETARNIADQANRTNLAAQVVEKILQEMEI